MGVLIPDKQKKECNHVWQTVDKDDSFAKSGRKEIRRKKVKCVKCGETKIRRVKRRLK